MLVGALEAFCEEVEGTLLCGTTVGQNRRTYRDLAVVDDEGSVFS
jgi:hypothetical protein